MILLVEDEEILRFSFNAFLESAGYQTVCAATFSEGLALIQSRELSLVITDIVLPDGNGIDLLKAVHGQVENECPVIMITGKPGIDTATQSVRNGAYDYLIKPVTKGALLSVVEKALNLHRTVTEKRQLGIEKDGLRRDLETIFSSVQEGIVTVDSEMRVIRVNQAMERICGCLGQDSVGRSLEEAGLRCSKDCLRQLKAAFAASGESSNHQIECRRSGRREQIVMSTTSPLKDKKDRINGAVLVVHDITRQKDLENGARSRNRYGKIIGGSPVMQEVYELLDNLRGSDSTVLLTGESGTGKELAAAELHYGSGRADKPFVRVNCASLSDSLLESELFGHVRGAFTGAFQDKIGRFEMAEGGTILLDEIADISMSVQLKLLRVLQEHEIERVGDGRSISINVRIIAATNKDLQDRMRRNFFRQDLYYRLKVVGVSLPPLRARIGDVPLLLDHFLGRFRQRTGKIIHGFSDQAKELLCSYPWPGNVRELEHAVEHGFVLSSGPIITRDHLPPEIAQQQKNSQVSHGDGENISLESIMKALDKTAGNKAKAARLLGISRKTIYRKLKQFEDRQHT